MRLSGKYLIGSKVDYSFSKESINFTSNNEKFIGISCTYKDSIYSLFYLKEDNTLLNVGTCTYVSSSYVLTWLVSDEYKILDFGVEQYSNNSSFDSFIRNCTTQQTIYLKSGTFTYNDVLVAGGLSTTTAEERQSFDLNAELQLGEELFKIKQIVIGYHYNNGYYYSYLGYIGDSFINDELKKENEEIAIYTGIAGSQGQWETHESTNLQQVRISTEIEVSLTCGTWFTANTNYKKIVKTFISGSYSGEGILDLPNLEEMVKCKFNFGLRRRDGEGLRVTDGGMFLFRGGEWQPFILWDDDNLEIIGYQVRFLNSSSDIPTINFGERQEVSLEFYENVTNNASQSPWPAACPPCLKNRKWKKELKPSTVVHTFYNPETHFSKTFVKVNLSQLNSAPPTQGVVLYVITYNPAGEMVEMEIPYVELYGGWISGVKYSDFENGSPTIVPNEGSVQLSDPIEYDLEGWESEVCSAVLLWEDTESTKSEYNLGKRKFKKNITPLKLEENFANEEEKYSWLYENRFEIEELSIVEQYFWVTTLGLQCCSPVIEKADGLVSFAFGLLIKYLVSLEDAFGVAAFVDIGDMEKITAEEFLEGDMFAPVTAMEFSLIAHSETTRDWLLENTDPVEEKIIPKGTYVILHKGPEVWKEQMLQKYGKEAFADTSYLQKLDFVLPDERGIIYNEIRLSCGLNDEEPYVDLYYKAKGLESEEIGSTTTTGYWVNDKARQITLLKDARVGKTFFDWFTEATDYKLVTGEESVLGWRTFNDTYIPLYLTSNSSWSQEWVEEQLETYGATISPFRGSETGFIRSGELCTPPIYNYNGNRCVVQGAVQNNETAGKITSYVTPGEEFGKVHELLTVEDQISAAWFYEHTHPVENIIRNGRYLFKNEVSRPTDWVEMPITFGVEYLSNYYICDKIRYNPDLDKLEGYIVDSTLSSSIGTWGIGYSYGEGAWLSEEVASWFVYENISTNPSELTWFKENTTRISGPRIIKSDAEKIECQFDKTDYNETLNVFNQYKIMITPQFKTLFARENDLDSVWCMGITPEIVDTSNEGDACQILGVISDPPETQDFSARAVNLENYITSINIIDAVSFDMVKWIANNTEEAAEIAGCWKWADIDKIVLPEQPIVQEVEFEAWEDGVYHYPGKEITWQLDNGIAFVSTKDKQENSRRHWDNNQWLDNSLNNSAQVFNFGRVVQIVDKKFKELLELCATPVYWRDYHFAISGKWKWDNKPEITDWSFLERLPIINGKQYDALVFDKALGTSYIAFGKKVETDEEEFFDVIMIYSSAAGWQETPWANAEVEALNRQPNLFLNAVLTDKWQVWDFEEQIVHLNKDMYTRFSRNTRDMSEKEFEKFEKTEKFVGEANSKSFQKITS